MEQTRADLAAEGRSHAPSAGELLVERMVKELKRPGRAGGRRLLRLSARRAEAPLAGAEDAVRDAGGAAPDDRDARAGACSTGRRSRRRAASPKGVLTSTHEANIGSIFGIGFPAWTGGAMQFIASEGRERFIATGPTSMAPLRAVGESRFAHSPEVRGGRCR